MEEEEELIPIISYHRGHKELLFHWPKTDELFVFKDYGYHNRLKMFGTSSFLHITREDLRLVGLKSILIS